MALIGAHTPGATPLTEEDIRGLKLASITTQGELNEAEAQNILRGQEWALRSRTRALSDMLSDEYLLRLHQEMFGDVWKWAGKFRQRDTNIGVPWHLIRTSLRELYAEVHCVIQMQIAKPISTPSWPWIIGILRHCLRSPGRTDHDARGELMSPR
jgi:fido (protein-threonine AMPylation protein)